MLVIKINFLATQKPLFLNSYFPNDAEFIKWLKSITPSTISSIHITEFSPVYSVKANEYLGEFKLGGDDYFALMKTLRSLKHQNPEVLIYQNTKSQGYKIELSDFNQPKAPYIVLGIYNSAAKTFDEECPTEPTFSLSTFIQGLSVGLLLSSIFFTNLSLFLIASIMTISGILFASQMDDSYVLNFSFA